MRGLRTDAAGASLAVLVLTTLAEHNRPRLLGLPAPQSRVSATGPFGPRCGADHEPVGRRRPVQLQKQSGAAFSSRALSVPISVSVVIEFSPFVATGADVKLDTPLLNEKSEIS